MTNKNKISIGIVALLISFFIWNFGFMNKYNLFNAKVDIFLGKPKIVTVGIPFSNKEISKITKNTDLKMSILAAW